MFEMNYRIQEIPTFRNILRIYLVSFCDKYTSTEDAIRYTEAVHIRHTEQFLVTIEQTE